jgi:hypothetical protein
MSEEKEASVSKLLIGGIITLAVAVVMGGLTQAIVMYTQIQITNERLKFVADKATAIESRLDKLQEESSDRWTVTKQAAYAAGVKAEIESLADELNDYTKEATTEHSLMKQRATLIEVKFAAIEQELRKLQQQPK